MHSQNPEKNSTPHRAIFGQFDTNDPLKFVTVITSITRDLKGLWYLKSDTFMNRNGVLLKKMKLKFSGILSMRRMYADVFLRICESKSSVSACYSL